MKAVGILTISRKKMLTVKILTTKSCLEESAQCRKVAVLAVVTDCHASPLQIEPRKKISAPALLMSSLNLELISSNK